MVSHEGIVMNSTAEGEAGQKDTERGGEEKEDEEGGGEGEEEEEEEEEEEGVKRKKEPAGGWDCWIVVGLLWILAGGDCNAAGGSPPGVAHRREAKETHTPPHTHTHTQRRGREMAAILFCQ